MQRYDIGLCLVFFGAVASVKVGACNINNGKEHKFRHRRKEMESSRATVTVPLQNSISDTV